MDLTA